MVGYGPRWCAGPDRTGPMPAQPALPVVIVGAGPYGLSVAAHLAAAGVPHRIFGTPMRTWRQGMPAGMLLKSDGFASSLSDPGGTYPLGAYCAEQGIPYADTEWGVPVEVFAAYGEAFQRRFVPHLETVTVARLARTSHGFEVVLEDGRRVAASRVVLATGLHPFAHLPPEFAGLPEGLVSHSRDAADLRHLAGRDVAVVGGGASALDVAASLHRAGAHATVIARRDTLRFYPPRAPRPLESLRAPRTPLGPGWKKLLVARAPLLFRLLPAGLRIDLVRRHLGPAPAWSVKETVEAHVAVHGAATIEAVRAEGGRVLLDVASNGERRTIEADHVIAATGFRIDLDRLAYLDPALRAEIACVEGSPVLSARFETSAPGIHVVGTAAAATFGPLLRFVCGAAFAARRVTGACRVAREATPVVAPAASGPRLAFLTLTDDIGSDRIVAQMGREGAACAVIGRPDSYAFATRFAEHRVRLPRRGGAGLARALVRGRLERLVREWGPDRIIPLDDLAARVLRRLATGERASPRLRALIIASTGDPSAYALSCSRDGLLTAAAAHGLRVPAASAAPDLAAAGTAARALGYPVVLKREETCGAGGVTLVHGPEDLAPAYAAARRRALSKRLLGRLVGLLGGEDARDPRRLGGMLGLQAFVPGRLAMRTVACRDGRVLEGLSLVAVEQHPVPVGASTVVAPIEHPEMENAVRVLVGLLKLSGFVSFDFLVDGAGAAHLIELNPRPIGSTHLGALFGHDLCRAYLADLAGAKAVPAADAPRWSGSVALFPRELMRDPTGARFRGDGSVWHDAIMDDPGVRERYLDTLATLHPAYAVHVRALVADAAPAPAVRPAEEAARSAA